MQEQASRKAIDVCAIGRDQSSLPSQLHPNLDNITYIEIYINYLHNWHKAKQRCLAIVKKYWIKLVRFMSLRSLCCQALDFRFFLRYIGVTMSYGCRVQKIGNCTCKDSDTHADPPTIFCLGQQKSPHGVLFSMRPVRVSSFRPVVLYTTSLCQSVLSLSRQSTVPSIGIQCVNIKVTTVLTWELGVSLQPRVNFDSLLSRSAPMGMCVSCSTRNGSQSLFSLLLLDSFVKMSRKILFQEILCGLVFNCTTRTIHSTVNPEQ